MNLLFSREAWEEYLVWQRENPQMVKRINQLIKEILRDPYRGLGKPEPLKHALQAVGLVESMRSIASYIVKGDLWIAQLPYH